jgi:hypothetical protein
VTGVTALLIVWWVWQSLPDNNFEPGYWVVQDAYVKKQSGMMAEVSGQVTRVLRDDASDIRYQRFVIRLVNDQDVIIVHDLNASERVPVNINDTVTVRGQYSWAETGGAIRWTHWDKNPNRPNGWIEHEGRRYD